MVGFSYQVVVLIHWLSILALNWVSLRDFQSHSSLDTTRRNSAELLSSGILTLLFVGLLVDYVVFKAPGDFMCWGWGPLILSQNSNSNDEISAGMAG